MMYDILLFIKEWLMKGGLVPMQTQSRPQLRDLQRVIAIGQSQEREGLKITALALEVYADGCLLTVSLLHTPTVSNPDGSIAHPEMFEVSMKDDLGNLYSGQVRGLKAWTESDFWQGRGECLCAPALVPDAHELHIEILNVQWMRWEETDQWTTRVVPDETTYGPWGFFVRFSDMEAKGQ
jgi:hypothetical protein